METQKTIKPGTFWKTHKVWIIPGGIILISGIAFAIYKKKQQENKGSDYGTSSTRSSKGFKCTSKGYPIGFGTCGFEVGILQRELIKRDYDLGRTGKKRDGVDHRFGEKTKKAALKEFGKATFSERDLKQITRVKTWKR